MRPRWLVGEAVVPAAGTCAAVGLVAFASGGYFPTTWGWAGLAFTLAALLAVLTRERIGLGTHEVWALALFAALTVWTVVSVVWSPSAAQPVLSAERLSVYVLALAAAFLLVTSRVRAPLLLVGVLAAIVIVVGYALVTRLAPGVATSYPPAGGYQLQEPIGYWNGLGILAAMGALLAFGLAASYRERALRMLALASLPVLLVALYFTFSRGSWLALIGGLGVSIAVDRRRLHLLGVVAIAAPMPAVAVLLATRWPALTHERATLTAARSAGLRLGIALLICVAIAAAAGWLLTVLERRVRLAERTQRRIAMTLVAAAVLVLVAGLVRVGGPAGLIDRARTSFSSSLPATGGDLNRRLTSLASDGRTDYWRVAWDEVAAHPWLGGGAGSYERYWHQLRPTAYEAQNAHNLYLETLAELGPMGLVLLLAGFGLPFLAAVRARAQPGTTAAVGAFTAFVLHNAIDWDFQIVAVTLAGLACAAALISSTRPDRAAKATSSRVRWATVGALIPVIVLAIAAQVGNSALAGSRSALDSDDAAQAAQLARRAQSWQPWSYEPWQLLGEAQLSAGQIAAARRSFQHAAKLDSQNWSVWLDLSEATTGAQHARALARARLLNPHADNS